MFQTDFGLANLSFSLGLIASNLCCLEAAEFSTNNAASVIPVHIDVQPDSAPFYKSVALRFEHDADGVSLAKGSTLFFCPSLERSSQLGFTSFSFLTGEIGTQKEHTFPVWTNGLAWVPIRTLGEDPDVALTIPAGFARGFFCALKVSGVVSASVHDNFIQTGPSSWDVRSTVYDLPGSTIDNLGLAFYRMYADGKIEQVAAVSPPHRSFTSIGIDYFNGNGSNVVARSIAFVGPASGVPTRWK